MKNELENTKMYKNKAFKSALLFTFLTLATAGEGVMLLTLHPELLVYMFYVVPFTVAGTVVAKNEFENAFYYKNKYKELLKKYTKNKSSEFYQKVNTTQNDENQDNSKEVEQFVENNFDKESDNYKMVEQFVEEMANSSSKKQEKAKEYKK